MLVVVMDDVWWSCGDDNVDGDDIDKDIEADCGCDIDDGDGSKVGRRNGCN